MNEKLDMKQMFDRHFRSLRFQDAGRQTVMDRAHGKEEPVMKKKMSVALAVAIVLTLTLVTALAAVAVMHSDQANKVNLSREALYEKYGLTPKTLGLFVCEGGEENGEYTLTWNCNTYHPSLTGVYTTVVKNGKATAAWTYDDTDQAVYDSGALSAPVWGHKQLEASFADKEKASGYSLALSAQDRENEINETPDHVSEPLADVEWIWQDEILHEAEPGENDLSAEQAYAIAVQALVEDFGMDADEIAANTAILEEDFLLRENGNGVWDICLYLILDGVDYDCAVWLDGATGEVLTIDVGTGGNG